MTTPNLPNAVQLHAAGFVTGGTGALGPGAANVAPTGVVRNGVGDYSITFGTEIDPATRVTRIQPVNAAARAASLQAQTDAGLQVLMFDQAGAAADSDFEFIVTRRSIDT